MNFKVNWELIALNRIQLGFISTNFETLNVINPIETILFIIFTAKFIIYGIFL
jgi:hypothetical protein